MQEQLSREPLPTTAALQKTRKTTARAIFEIARAVVVSTLYLLIMLRIIVNHIAANTHSTVI